MATKPAKGPGPAIGVEAIAAMVHDAVKTQERALNMTQGWAESVLGTLKDQADSYGAMLRSVDSSLRAMERAVTSQAKSTKALADSLEASRQVVSAAVDAQQQGIERVETFLGGTLEVLGGQLQALRSQVEMGQQMLSDPVAAQSEMFVKASQGWMDAYSRLLGTAPIADQREADG